MRTKHMVPSSIDEGINALPDDLLALIVSYLPTKESVATSVLSPRWRYIWASSPVLDFDFPSFPYIWARKSAFLDFIRRALDLFSASELRKFRICLHGFSGDAPPGLEHWVDFALRHAVQELALLLPKGKSFKIPDSVFSRGGSIAKLWLDMDNYSFELPPPSGLRSLKKLHLSSVSLLHGRFIKDVFLHCELLEELEIEWCDIYAMEFNAPKLKRLTWINWICTHPVRIKISAPRLESFSYAGLMVDRHLLEDLPALARVALSLDGASCLFETSEELQMCFLKLLWMLRGARVLSLSSWCVQQLYQEPGLSQPFRGDNVKRLELCLEYSDDSLLAVMSLLGSFPNVEILKVYMLRHKTKRRAPQDQVQFGSRNTMKQLKAVILDYIDLSKTGLDLVKYLLKNARLLEKMNIRHSKGGLELVSFQSKVSKFRKASRIVDVQYSTTA